MSVCINIIHGYCMKMGLDDCDISVALIECHKTISSRIVFARISAQASNMFGKVFVITRSKQ